MNLPKFLDDHFKNDRLAQTLDSDQKEAYLYLTSLFNDLTNLQALQPSECLPQNVAKISQFTIAFLDKTQAVLKSSSISHVKLSSTNLIRQQYFMILSRLPLSTNFLSPNDKTQAIKTIFPIFTEIIFTENEENSSIVMKVAIELFKQQKSIELTPEIKNFIQVVNQKAIEIYTNVIEEWPSKENRRILPTVLASTDEELNFGEKTDEIIQLPNAMSCLSTLKELPLLILLLISIYKQKILEDSVISIAPLVARIINSDTDTWENKLDPESKELFVVAQVKMVTFLAFIMKTTAFSQLDLSTEELTTSIFRIIKNCSPNATTAKRDILLAFSRFNQNNETSIKTEFVKHIDKLTDDHFMVGTDITSKYNLRNILFNTTLPDFVQHTRNLYSFDDLEKIGSIFAAKLDNDEIPITVHYMCCKVVWYLINNFHKIAEESDDHRKKTVDILLKHSYKIAKRLKKFNQVDMPAYLELIIKKVPTEISKESLFDDRTVIQSLFDMRAFVSWALKTITTLDKTVKHVLNKADGSSAEIEIGPICKKIYQKIFKYGFGSLKIFRLDVNLQPFIDPKDQVSDLFFTYQVFYFRLGTVALLLC